MKNESENRTNLSYKKWKSESDELMSDENDNDNRQLMAMFIRSAFVIVAASWYDLLCAVLTHR